MQLDTVGPRPRALLTLPHMLFVFQMPWPPLRVYRGCRGCWALEGSPVKRTWEGSEGPEELEVHRDFKEIRETKAEKRDTEQIWNAHSNPDKSEKATAI